MKKFQTHPKQMNRRYVTSCSIVFPGRRTEWSFSWLTPKNFLWPSLYCEHDFRFMNRLKKVNCYKKVWKTFLFILQESYIRLTFLRINTLIVINLISMNYFTLQPNDNSRKTMNVLDPNVYATKKTIAQGNIAIFLKWIN